MLRRVMSGVVAIIGVVLIVSTFANDLFNVGPAFDELTDGFRSHMTDESIGALQADLVLLGDVPEAFGALAPSLGAALGMDGAQLNAFIGENFPQVANGLAALPEIVPEFTGFVATLDEQQENFAGADAIPTDSLPAATVPWGLFAVGIIAIAIAVVMYLRSDRLGPILAVGLGALVIVGSLVLSLVGKAGDADDLNEALKPVYTAETVEGGKQGLAVVAGMGQQMQEEMLPALAQQLGMTPDDLGAFIGGESPIIAQALQTMPEALARFDGLLADFDANLDNYGILRPVALSPIIWTLLIGALVMLIAGAVVLVTDRKQGEAAT